MLIEVFLLALEEACDSEPEKVVSSYTEVFLVYFSVVKKNITEEKILKKIEELGGKEETIMTILEERELKGIEEGRQEVIQAGELKRAKEIARELLRDGLPVETAAKYTKLTLEEVKQVKREIIEMSDFEEIKNNIKYIDDTFKKLGLTAVKPVINSSITILGKNGRPINVIRLTRPQLFAIKEHLAWIKAREISWSYTLKYWQDTLSFSRLFVTLEELFGPNDEKGTDDGYKSSFCFHFLIKFPEEKENLGLVMIMHDIKGWIHYEFAKILHLDEYEDRNNMPNTFKDFTEEDMDHIVCSFYKYLENYFEEFINYNFDSSFYKTITTNLAVYGYKDGDFFDEGYDTPEEYEEVLEELKSIKNTF